VVVGLLEGDDGSPQLSVGDAKSAFEPVGIDVPARASGAFLLRRSLQARTAEAAEVIFCELVATVPIARFFRVTNINVRPAEVPVAVAGSSWKGGSTGPGG
jgi:hypothetical protein